MRYRNLLYYYYYYFQCLLLENIVFWQCSLLIGSASSLECNQYGCGVVHLGYARSIFWTLCDDQKCLQTRMLVRMKQLLIPWWCVTLDHMNWD